MPTNFTAAQLARKAWIMAAPGTNETETKLLIPHVEAMIPEAAKIVCDRVFLTRKWRYLQNTVSGSFSTDTGTGLGIATLSTAVMGDSLIDGTKGFLSVSTFPRPLQYVPTIHDLYNEKLSTELGYFTVEGGTEGSSTIYGALWNGSPLTGNITGRACVYFDITSLPSELLDEFLDALADMAREKLLVARTTQRLTGSAGGFTSDAGPVPGGIA